ncbi:hypothetical protein [Bergeyella zoohelcum]|uniref:Uncharacterized protein n=2 Tax=Bergeyella zoohelcum TaxID=1015 RepID=K1LZS4_9FLAO|nr:hypothetical protein [Bergeyella zoohelcum]EKB57542.1 hypothetical protein HMPREF9699_01028 [Bergeyella zoohelcum ATCC 43767]EKB58445.1 hypothetical protein HMPREF9700_01897 [Bergeyella zoohelcum CCUG 30536]MDY6024910.1 hypothetical protein [Bergeyella zoohelcum]SSZ55974.1 Uncharacterised protein [Bergeyella zoohelcum]SUV48788.1 Uncharacterised protein [Bergeyella zoohelcum]
MKQLKSPKLWIGSLIAFIIVFLMSYLGNSQEDRLERALMVAAGGAIGMFFGLLFLGNTKDQFPDKFD